MTFLDVITCLQKQHINWLFGVSATYRLLYYLYKYFTKIQVQNMQTRKQTFCDGRLHLYTTGLIGYVTDLVLSSDYTTRAALR